MENKKYPRLALVSVYNKEGLIPLARALEACGYGFVSSSGTAKFLTENGFDVIDVGDVTGYPSILGGRVKTLHPAIFGGILSRRTPGDLEDMARHGISGIDMVVCNLYPFEETALRGAELDELIEKIDIGGVTLLRAAAKNYAHVGLLMDCGDYEDAIRELEMHGELSLDMRRAQALKAFNRTSAYDAIIRDGLKKSMGIYEAETCSVSTMAVKTAQTLRYGENPYQGASLMLPPLADAPFELLGGKELSYNNLLDLDTVLKGSAMYQDECVCVIAKHATPCGVANGKSPAHAFRHAYVCDPVSAFGGILSFNRAVDADTAALLAEHFFEVICAPSFDCEAVRILREKKPNLRIVRPNALKPWSLRYTSTWAGMLVQDDILPPIPKESEGTWHGVARSDMWHDMIFAWKAAALAKSNAIVVVKDGGTLGIGCGFPNRVDAARHALRMCGSAARGAAMASDAFFPFPDCVELAADAGIGAIIQPGGSMKDKDVAARAVELGVPMFVGGVRTFRH